MKPGGNWLTPVIDHGFQGPTNLGQHGGQRLRPLQAARQQALQQRFSSMTQFDHSAQPQSRGCTFERMHGTEHGLQKRVLRRAVANACQR